MKIVPVHLAGVALLSSCSVFSGGDPDYAEIDTVYRVQNGEDVPMKKSRGYKVTKLTDKEVNLRNSSNNLIFLGDIGGGVSPHHQEYLELVDIDGDTASIKYRYFPNRDGVLFWWFP